MSVVTEKDTEAYVASSVSLNRNRLIFFALNFALILPFIVKHYFLWGLVGVAVLLLAAFYLTVVKPGHDAPASRDIPVLLFFDACIFFGMSYEVLLENFEIENCFILLDYLQMQCLGLLVAGVVLSILASRKQKLIWIKGPANTAIGAAFIMQVWSNGELLDPVFNRGGEAVLALYLMCSLIWYILCVVSHCIDPDMSKRNHWLSAILLCFFCALCLTEYPILLEFTQELKTMVLLIPTANFAWWKVALSAAVLLGCAAASYDYDSRAMGSDSLVLSFLASGIVLLKVLMSNYFTFSWVIFLVFLLGTLRCLKLEQNQYKMLRLASANYLAAQFCALFLTVMLIKAGLWINVLILGVYGLLFYATAGKGKPKRTMRHWLTVLSLPAVFSVAYVWYARFSLDTLLIIAAAYAVFGGAIVIICWPHPNGLTGPVCYKVIICGFMVLLCLIVSTRYGTDAQIQFDGADHTASITLSARGRENQVESATYSWSDITGKTIGEERTLSGTETVLPIEGEKLTLTITDTYGFVTTKTEWYPHWLIDADGYG